MKRLKERLKAIRQLLSNHWLKDLCFVLLICLLACGLYSLSKSAAHPCEGFRGIKPTCSTPKVPVEAESVLYGALKTDPASISMLEYESAGPDILVNLQNKSTYQVNVTDAAEAGHIRSLALAAKPPVVFQSGDLPNNELDDASPNAVPGHTSANTDSITLSVLIPMLLLFGALFFFVARRERKRNKTINSLPTNDTEPDTKTDINKEDEAYLEQFLEELWSHSRPVWVMEREAELHRRRNG